MAAREEMEVETLEEIIPYLYSYPASPCCRTQRGYSCAAESTGLHFKNLLILAVN